MSAPKRKKDESEAEFAVRWEAFRERGREYEASPKGRAAKAKYKASPEGRESEAKYRASPKGIARTARYEASPERRASRAEYNTANRSQRTAAAVERRQRKSGNDADAAFEAAFRAYLRAEGMTEEDLGTVAVQELIADAKEGASEEPDF